MRGIILFLTLGLTFVNAATWPNSSYVEVRGYSYNPESASKTPVEYARPLFENGKMNKTVIDKEGVILNKTQEKQLLEAINIGTVKYPVAACFLPRHAFVFYDAEHNPIAYIEVCFECSNTQLNPNTLSTHVDLPALAELCNELKLPQSPDKNYRKRFDRLRKELSSH